MLKRSLRYLSFSVALLLLAAPMVLYTLGLRGVIGVPGKPRVLASQEQQILVWTLAQGKGVPRIDGLNPYSVTFGLLSGKPPANDPGSVVAWWVASDYLLEHRRHANMSWWHFSGAALTIWLSRNWSTEELLSKAFELTQTGRLKKSTRS